MSNRLEDPSTKLGEYFGEHIGQMLGALNRGMTEPGYAGLADVHEEVAEWMSTQWRNYLEKLHANKLIDKVPDGFMVKRCEDGSLYIQAMQIPKGLVVYGTKKMGLKSHGIHSQPQGISSAKNHHGELSKQTSPTVFDVDTSHQNIVTDVENFVSEMEQSELDVELLPSLHSPTNNLMAFVDREERVATQTRQSLKPTERLNSTKISTGMSEPVRSEPIETSEAKPLKRRTLVRNDSGKLEAKD